MSVTSLEGMFTVREFADYARISFAKARRMIAAGEIHASKFGGCVRILARDVRTWEDSLSAKPVTTTALEVAS